MSKLAEKISDAQYTVGAAFERSSKQYTRSLVPSDEHLKIFDVGCGTGVNAEELAAQSHTAIGVDISSVAIEQFRQKEFEGKQCDITKGISYKGKKFDFVFTSEIIEHIEDAKAFLAELFRIPRPSVLLVLSTVYSAFWVFRFFSLSGRTVTEVQHPGHICFFSKLGLAEYVLVKASRKQG
ncbi:class I SAM-dependent methyltransferase [Thermodesulfobacteriota bacterium]